MGCAPRRRDKVGKRQKKKKKKFNPSFSQLQIPSMQSDFGVRIHALHIIVCLNNFPLPAF